MAQADWKKVFSWDWWTEWLPGNWRRWMFLVLAIGVIIIVAILIGLLI